MDEEDEKEFVALANEFLQKCSLNGRVERLTDCRDAFFVSLFQGLIGDNLKGLAVDPMIQDERIQNCQCVIDGLAKDVLNVDLSHISAEGIIKGDIISIRNLLEIFSGLLEYFMECIDENQSDFEDDFDDSNLMTTEHDVISSLLKEEFGSSYSDMSRSGKYDTTKGQQAIANQSAATNTRISTEPSLRLGTFTGSGHEADTSEVSDSTNELIRLGESSSGSNSTLRKTAPAVKSLSLQAGRHQGPVKTTWELSAVSVNRYQQELTQYSMTSEDGEKDSIALDNKNSSDNLSSSLVSSTSSWRQQISPLDVESDGIKLDTLGLRPKVDSLTVAAKDSSDDGGSGRSTPILHHHYHHHFHHPVGSDNVKKTDNIKDYTKVPGNLKSLATGIDSHTLLQNKAILPGHSSGSGIPSVTLPEYSHTNKSGLPGQSMRSVIPGTSFSEYTSRGAGFLQQRTKSDKASVTFLESSSEATRLPGQSHISHRQPSVPLSDYSRLGTGITGGTSGVANKAFSDYTTGSGLPGQSHTSNRIPSVPLPDYSRLGTGITGQGGTSGVASKAFSDYTTTGSGLPGQSHTSNRIPSVPLPDYSRLGTGITGQGVTSGVASKAFPDYTTTGSGLPGQSHISHRQPSVPLSDYSRLGTGITGQGVTSGVASKAFPDYTTTGSGLPGQSYTSNRIPSVPLSDYSRLGTGITGPSVGSTLGQRSSHERYLSKEPSLPSTSLATTTSLPSSSGLLTVSSGGLSDVFTTTGTTDLRKQYMPTLSRSMETRQPNVFDGQERLVPGKEMVSTERPTTGRESSRDTALSTAITAGETHEDVDVESLDSDADLDSDDSNAARYSDSAIDYNRGGVQDDSEGESGSTEDSILHRIHDRWKRLKASQSSKPARRAVTFNADIETIPITSRMDRLKRLLADETEEQRQHTSAIRNTYAEQLQDIQKQQQQERREMKKSKVQKSPLVPKKKKKKTVPAKQRGRLEAIYRPQGRLGRPTKRPPVKSRKRSASASPDIGRRRKNTLADFHETLLPSLFEEFPFLHVSPQTTHAMWQKQARQVSLLSKSDTAAKKTKSQRCVEEAEKRQERLLKILRKELEYNQRMRGECERQDHQRAVKTKVNDKRQVAARARRYYDEYQVRMRSKMLKRRTREEQILKRLFDDGLEIQKQRVRELRKYAREKTEVIEEKQTNEIESLENYYKDQFSMLAEGMTRERHELKVRQQAQEKVMRQMRREMRQKMEKEIRDLQETLTRDEDSAYFRQLEADRLRREFQLAMYKSDL